MAPLFRNPEHRINFDDNGDFYMYVIYLLKCDTEIKYLNIPRHDNPISVLN